MKFLNVCLTNDIWKLSFLHQLNYSQGVLQLVTQDENACAHDKKHSKFSQPLIGFEDGLQLGPKLVHIVLEGSVF